MVTVFCMDRLDRPAVRCAVDTCKLEHILQNIFHSTSEYCNKRLLINARSTLQIVAGIKKPGIGL